MDKNDDQVYEKILMMLHLEDDFVEIYLKDFDNMDRVLIELDLYNQTRIKTKTQIFTFIHRDLQYFQVLFSFNDIISYHKICY